MAEVAEVKPCSNPGCDQPGTSSCSACKTTVYCCVICQTADWSHHKEECQGHLRKVGMANLVKARGFERGRSWVQALRYGELAAVKLKQLKDRHLETVEAIDEALTCKCNALQRLDRQREALEGIKECYTLWAMNHLRNPGSMRAALNLIQSCIHNEEYEDAERYARHAYFMIAEMTDNFIPADDQQWFLAYVSYYLALAIHGLALAGGIPPEQKQKAGEEAIGLARKALEIHTQLFGIENADVAADMGTFATVLDYFNDVDDDEVLRLQQQAIAIISRVEGSSSVNVAVNVNQLGIAYINRANRAQAVNDLDSAVANSELALTHFREAARIFRDDNHVSNAEAVLRRIAGAEEAVRNIRIFKAAVAAAAAATIRG